MKILLMDGSPKSKGSTSAYLLKALEERLPDGNQVTWQDARAADPQDIAAAIKDADAVAIAFPLYVDSIPSHLLRLLEAVQPLLQTAASRPMVYAIVNSGFYDARQNHIALAMIRIWAEKCGLPYGGGLGIGGGGMAQAAPLGHGPVTGMGKSMDVLVKHVLAEEATDDLYVEPNFPRFLYKTMAHIGWRHTARKNGISASQLMRRLV